MKKRKILLTILLTTLIMGIAEVNAYTFGVGYADTGDGGNPEESTDKTHELGKTEYGDKTIVHNCIYNYTVSATNNITINGYNDENEPIMESSLNISDEDRIPAGTAIGISIYETKTITWSVTQAEAKVTTYEKGYNSKYLCSYTNRTISPVRPPRPEENIAINSIMVFSRIQSIALNCSTNNYYVYNNTSCSSKNDCTVSKDFVEYEPYDKDPVTVDDTAEYQEKCKEHAAKEVIDIANGLFTSSYSVNLSDSNNINGNSNVEISNEDANATRYCPNGCSFSYRGSLSESKTVSFTYKKNKSCMDVITSKVTYKNTCGENEITVNNENINGIQHWHYFVPLNAKSNQYAEINLHPAGGGELNYKQCLYVMKDNPVVSGKTSYTELIVKKDDTNFVGDYYKGENASSDIDYITDNGCKLTSKVKIKIVQKFYNEVTNGNTKKFEGFNFYYKPISTIGDLPTSVFQNGIETTSLWKDWYDKWKNGENASPNISQSYDSVTYIAQNINSSKVREYTKNNAYNTWKNMNADGTSDFIDDEGIITRGNNVVFYKLGCGPSNSDWSDCK